MKKKESDRSMFAPETPSAPRISPEDIQAKEFRIARFRGYREHDVDEFLDQLTLVWSALLDENDRLRAQVGGGANRGSAIGAPDLQDVSLQADEIIRRARAEAAQILRDASTRAGAATAGSAPGDTEIAAVSAFLTNEREFLKSLASLVQGHAEGVKGLARDVYAKPHRAEVSAGVSETEVERASATSRAESAGSASGGAEPEAEEPIRVDEAEPAKVRASQSEIHDDRSDRSLRELFWGEE